MSLKNVTPGDKAPEAFNVVIEIPMHGDPIKYEVDKQSGALFVDRFMSAAMYYPANYGYVPQTTAIRWTCGSSLPCRCRPAWLSPAAPSAS